jgi:hypothetical protein
VNASCFGSRTCVKTFSKEEKESETNQLRRTLCNCESTIRLYIHIHVTYVPTSHHNKETRTILWAFPLIQPSLTSCGVKTLTTFPPADQPHFGGSIRERLTFVSIFTSNIAEGMYNIEEVIKSTINRMLLGFFLYL